MAATAERLTQLDNHNHQRELGRLAIHDKLSNDSLAHVRRLIEEVDPHEVEHQVRAEFHTDIGERTGHANKERHYYKTWDFRLEGNDLISDTGLSLRELTQNGLEAAANDARKDKRFDYHLQRAQVQALHPDMLVQWRRSGDPRCVRIVSLCPEENEISAEIAKLGNFKPERAMASDWIFEPTETGVRLYAFSQDNSTLETLEFNDRQMGISGGNYSSSLAKLAQLDYLPYTDGLTAVKVHKEVHDRRLERLTGKPHHFGIENPLTYEEAIAAVESKPKAWQLYWEAVQGVAGSLENKRVTPELGKLVMELRQGYDPEDVPHELRIHWQRPFSESQARQFMDYLRERAIPQYVFGAPETYISAKTNGESNNYGELATAGAYSVENSIVHSGDCPGSGGGQVQTQHSANTEIASALQISGTKIFESDKCRNCKGHRVRAWLKGEVVGCFRCGRQENVCTGEVVNEGEKSENTEQKPGLFQLLFMESARYEHERKQKEAIKREQKEKTS